MSGSKKDEKQNFRKRHTAYAKRSERAHQQAGADQHAALVETMVIAACIDGILAPGEDEVLAAQILSTPGFDKLDNKGLATTVESVADRVAKDGIEVRLKHIATSLGADSTLREEAFRLATLFVHYDGEVGEEEQSFLDALQGALEITDERASHIDAELTERMAEV